MDYSYIINNQENLQEIFNSKTWKKGIDIEKKETIILSLFHSKNWIKILPENRIYILQEVENIEADKQKRKPYKLVIVEENNYYEKQFDLLLIHYKKEIYIKDNLIEKGIKQKMDCKNQITQIDINDILNEYLLENIYHEGNHIKTELRIKQNLENFKYFIQNEATTEEKEYIIWLLTKIDTEDIKGPKTVLEIVKYYYLYRTVPGEYYAFQTGREKTAQAFKKIQKEFGIDDTYQKYVNYLEQEEKEVEESYLIYTGKKLNYNQIYKKTMREMIEEMAKQYKVEADTIFKEYCLQKENYIIEDKQRDIE